MILEETTPDQELTERLRDANSGIGIPEGPSLHSVTSRGRSLKMRRLSGIAGALVASTAVVALTLSFTGALGGTAAPSAGGDAAARSTAHAVASNDGTVTTAAFTLSTNSNGTDSLTLTMNQVLNSATLQQALAAHGIPALVMTGTYCTSDPAAPDPVSTGVLTVERPSGAPATLEPAPASGPLPSGVAQMAARTVTVINPAALPSGTELFFGYSPSLHAVYTGLIYTDSYSCSDLP